MLNDDLDRSQRHVAARDFVCGSCAPLVGRYRLQEMFNGGEQLYGIESRLLQILWYVTSKLPDTFEDQLSDLCFLGVRHCAATWERFDDLQQERKESTGTTMSASLTLRQERCHVPEHRHTPAGGEYS